MLILSLLIAFALLPLSALAQEPLPKPDVTRFGNRFFYNFPDEAERALTEVWSADDPMERIKWADPDKPYKREDTAPETRCFRVRLLPADESAHSLSPWSDWHAYSSANPSDDPALCEPSPTNRKRKRKSGSAPKPLPKPIRTCELLPDHIVVKGTVNGTQCQIGFVDLPKVVEAVDVWGNLGAGAEVCIRKAGVFVFYDAATAPRTLMRLAAEYRDGWSCACIERLGTVVLLEEDEAARLFIPTVSLESCQVVTRLRLNLRDSPAGRIVGIVPEGMTLSAAARTPGWFHVQYNGEYGWIYADYADAQDTCA